MNAQFGPFAERRQRAHAHLSQLVMVAPSAPMLADDLLLNNDDNKKRIIFHCTNVMMGGTRPDINKVLQGSLHTIAGEFLLFPTLLLSACTELRSDVGAVRNDFIYLFI